MISSSDRFRLTDLYKTKQGRPCNKKAPTQQIILSTNDSHYLLCKEYSSMCNVLKQVYRTIPPIEPLQDLLVTYGEKTDKFVLIRPSTFNRIRYHEKLFPYLHSLEPHFHMSKLTYCTRRPFAYKNFMTLVRQICKLHRIPVVPSIRYDHSNYEMQYSVFFPLPSTKDDSQDESESSEEHSEGSLSQDED
jgi:hypothetical protein